MIVYDLKCAQGHRFEGWFGSAEDFGRQRAGSLLSCPSCGEDRVERMPSATRINLRSSQADPVEPAQKVPAEFAGKDPIAVAQMVYSRMLDEMLTRSEDVGEKFAEEARRIHYEQSEVRSIRGVATRAQYDELADEGIPVLRIPVPGKEQLN